MAKPLAPYVHGPILTSSTHVLLSNVLPDAVASVRADGERVGAASTSAGGTLWVELDRKLSSNTRVTAIQEFGGVSSEPNNQPVPVLEVPDPLPAPTFSSPVTECMDHVLLGALVPGATVSVELGNTVLAAITATGTSEWVAINPTPLVAGAQLTARQDVDGATSAKAFSMRLAEITQRENLPAPVIAGPLYACDTSVLASGLIPAGHLDLEQDGNAQFWVNIAETYWATGGQPLREGALVARQSLPGCGGISRPVQVTVAQAVAPPEPVMQPFCPDARRVVVTGLKPGGVLTLWRKVWNQTAETEIGSVGIGTTTVQVDLPDEIGGSGEIMAIVARQTLCGLTSAPGSSMEFARPGAGALPPPTPSIVAPLTTCMSAVPVQGMFAGVLTQVFSVRHGTPLSDPVAVSAPTSRIPVWFPLEDGDEVEVRQHGCSAPAKTAPERVRPLPSPLPPPKVVEPVRPGDRVVRVTGCLPGSRVHLLVDWIERAATDQTWTGEAVLHLPQSLKEGHLLWAVQTMCTSASTLEGPYVTVTKGQLQVKVTPDTAPGGKATSFVVVARDRGTGEAVVGLPVILGGAPVGVTGTAFAWTPPTSGSTATGVVQGGSAYSSAGFTITIRQAVPLRLTLFPGPVVQPGTVWQTDVVWTVTPRWTGGSAVTVTGNTGTAMVPPPGSDNRVGVSLALKAHLQGEIGGIAWPYQVIVIEGHLADVALTGAGHALSARFWYQAVDVPVIVDGQVTGWETRLAAGVHLFVIS